MLQKEYRPPLLNKSDRELYTIVSANSDIKCEPESGRCHCEETIRVEKHVDEEVVWYYRFPDGADAKFVSAELMSDHDDTRFHRTPSGDDEIMEDIKFILPRTDPRHNNVAFRICYERNYDKTNLYKKLKYQMMLFTFYCQYSSHCQRLRINISFTRPKTKIVSLLTPASYGIENSTVKIEKPDLEAMQFTPVAIVAGIGRRNLNEWLGNLRWAFFTALLGAGLTYLIGVRGK